MHAEHEQTPSKVSRHQQEEGVFFLPLVRTISMPMPALRLEFELQKAYFWYLNLILYHIYFSIFSRYFIIYNYYNYY